MMSGRIGPRILVNSDITKNTRKTTTIMYLLLIWARSLRDFVCAAAPKASAPELFRTDDATPSLLRSDWHSLPARPSTTLFFRMERNGNPGGWFPECPEGK